MALTTILIRDDDICYFTDVHRFTMVHRMLLDRHLPFNVAVIPLVSDLVHDGQGGVEGFIPRSLQNQGKSYEIALANELCSFLRRHTEIEVLQHGLQHVRHEDGSVELAGGDETEMEGRLCRGKEMLREAFSRTPVFLVPPFDTVSPAVLVLIKKHYRGICFSRYSHHLLPFWLWPEFKLAKWRNRHLLKWGDFILLSHPGSDLAFLPDTCWTLSSLPARDVLVVTVHSWMFFDHAGEIKTELLAKYEGFLRVLLREPGIRFKRFAELLA